MSRQALVFLGAVAFPIVLLVAATVMVREHYAMDIPPRLPDEARAAAMAPLRAALDGQGKEGELARPAHPALGRPLAGPAIVTVWSRGRRYLRVEGKGATAADALLDAARRIAESPVVRVLGPDRRLEARLQVDLVVARGPFHADPGPRRAFGLVPGLDGLAVDVLGREVYLGADELVLERLLMGARPFTFMEFSAGLDFDRADAHLGARAALGPGVYGGAARSYFRFRADSFVERPRSGRAAPP
jgi:hypothetical protein